MQTPSQIIKCLKSNNLTLALAESCSGGLLSHSLTNVPGASSCFLGSIVCYDNAVKTRLLGVTKAVLSNHGAVSQQCATQMAKGAKRLLQSDYALSITGIAGPSGGSATKPVGLVYIALSTPKTTITQSFHFKGSRLQIKKQTVAKAIQMLGKAL